MGTMAPKEKEEENGLGAELAALLFQISKYVTLPSQGGVNDKGQTGQGVAPSIGRKLRESGNKESPLIAFSQHKGIHC